MKALRFVLFFAAMPLASQARIGETFEQIVARFGKPSSREGQTAVWGPEGLIYVVVLNEKSVSIAESIGPQDSLEKLTDVQIEIFLSANLKKELQWKRIEVPLSQSEFEFGGVAFGANPLTTELQMTSDKKLLCRRSRIPGQNSIWIYSEEGAQAMLKQKTDRDEKAAVKF